MSLSDDPTTDDQHLIDRLVDGELDPDARRALLARFEADPAGWRRCALAFLEAQSWREALAPPAGEPASRSEAFPVIPRSVPRASDAQRWRPRVAVAAGWLSAFALGWLASGAASTPKPGPPVVATSGTPTIAGRPAPPSIRPDRSETASAETSPDEDEHAAIPRRPPTLVAIPVLDARRLGHAPMTVPGPVRRDLERRGFQVESRHGLMPMRLPDGRRVAVPVDALRMRYVGNRTL